MPARNLAAARLADEEMEPDWLHPRSPLAPPPQNPEALGAAQLNVDPALDLAGLADTFTGRGHVRFSGFLADGATELYDHLQQSSDWIHVITKPRGVTELSMAARRRLGPKAVTELREQAQLRSRGSFQYSYEAIRVPDADEAASGDDLLDRFALLMARPETLRLLSTIVGAEVGGFTEGQATAYGPGDFLTLHDDGVRGKDRLAAFVYGLTPGWRVDWGGLLLFHDDNDRSAEALAPRFDALDLFAVPRLHSVSIVSRAASHRRYAITGWLTRA